MRPSGMWRRLRKWARSWSRRARSATLLAPAGADDPPSGADDALAPGTELKEFVIERVLGVGGFGVTYLARDVSLDAWRPSRSICRESAGSGGLTASWGRGCKRIPTTTAGAWRGPEGGARPGPVRSSLHRAGVSRVRGAGHGLPRHGVRGRAELEFGDPHGWHARRR